MEDACFHSAVILVLGIALVLVVVLGVVAALVILGVVLILVLVLIVHCKILQFSSAVSPLE